MQIDEDLLLFKKNMENYIGVHYSSWDEVIEDYNDPLIQNLMRMLLDK